MMFRRAYTLLIILLLLQPGIQRVSAQVPAMAVLKGLAKRVLKAIDLKIQREQNEVIWLQNAQKALENTMSKLRLGEISEWTEKQRKLYAGYFEELRTVKARIATYNKVRAIISGQLSLVNEYGKAWDLLKKDKNFTPEELEEMYRTYTGILNESAKNLDQLMLVVNSFKTQMSDGARMELINEAADNLDDTYTDLKRFNRRNYDISISRETNDTEILRLKTLYDIK